MKKIYLISIAALALAISSCSKDSLEDTDGLRSDSSIGITNIVATPALTRADAVSSTSVSSYTDEAAGIFLNVEKTVEPIDFQIVTKGTEYTTSNLGSFILDGYLDNEITRKIAVSDEDKADQHFIVAPADPGYNVVKDGTAWKFDGGDYKWRYGVHHHFWAHTPSASNLTSPLTFLKKTNSTENDTTKVSFNYKSDGSEDFLVSYKNQYFGKDEETALKNEALGLTFNHALSEVQVNVNEIQFKVRRSGYADAIAPAGRCSVDTIYFRKVMESGTCTSDQGSCTWDNLSGGDIESNVLQLNAGSPSFLIPQISDSIVLHIAVKDTRRQLTRPYIFKAKNVFKTGNWLPGYKYGYNFTGTFIVPWLPDGENGLNANFAGKPFQSLPVINDVDIKYIKKIKLSWTNHIIMSGASGTNVAIGWEYGSTAPSVNDYKSGNKFDISNAHIGWSFCDGAVLKGTPLGTVTPSSTNVYDFDSELEFDMTNFDIVNYHEITIWCSYMGSDAGHDIQWNMKNMKLEITEWR